MSIIEQAAKRLEELKKAGVEVGEDLHKPEASEQASPSGGRENAAVAGGVPDEAQAGKHRSEWSRRVNIDLAHVSAAGIVTPDAPRSQVADEFRVIKRPLIGNAKGKGAAPVKNGNLIMVTSAMPGEGKSFTSINLAMSIAMELDNTVLLVDADVARPSVLNLLGLPPTKGLLDVLLDESLDLSSVMLRTSVEKLSILPSGTPHQRATELLASEAMNRLIDEIASRYPDRIIIFDSPPLLVTTEARVLASHMGQVVIVVEAERTPHSTIKQALATIESCPIKLMVLNKTRNVSAGGYYGYYSYGGYGYGG